MGIFGNVNFFDACMSCKNRRVGCQADCETYKQAKAKHDERRRIMKHQEYMAKGVDRYERDTARKLTEAKRLKR